MMKTDIIPIEVSADLMTHLGSDYYYIRHIFNALREHKELLENPEYKRLYDEAIDYIFRYAVKNCEWDINEREWGYGFIELLADLQNSDDKKYNEKYSIETVDSFLAERRKIWSE